MSMPQPPWTDAGFVLANWEVRPRHGTLLSRERAGEVVTRDEFSAEVWGGRVV